MPGTGRKTVFTTLFAALTAVCGVIAIPVGVSPAPIVLQNMMTVLSGLLLGPVLGTCSTAVFVLAGVIGLPVFSGGTGGIAKIMGPTGGFIIGYIFASLLAGLVAGKPSQDRKTSAVRLALACALGFVIMYIPGVIHFMRSLGKTFSETMAMCVIPYVPGDIIKAVLSVLVAVKVRKTVALYVFKDEKN